MSDFGSGRRVGSTAAGGLDLVVQKRADEVKMWGVRVTPRSVAAKEWPDHLVWDEWREAIPEGLTFWRLDLSDARLVSMRDDGEVPRRVIRALEKEGLIDG